MDLIKPTKAKFSLFINMIFSSFLVAILFMFISRFAIQKYYFGQNRTYYLVGYYIFNVFRYFFVAYLATAFYTKDFSLAKRAFNIFRFGLLLWMFSFFYHQFLAMVSRIKSEIFFSISVNWIFVALNLFLYYILICIVYYLDYDKKNKK